jgi:hypothetical protein
MTLRSTLTAAFSLSLSVFLVGCSNSPTAPTAAPVPVPTIGDAASTTSDLSYAINIPDAAVAQQLIAAYPHGVRVGPIAAQTTWNETLAYGAANVYYGPTAPPTGLYAWTGIVVAPLAVAGVDTFWASDWPDQYGQPLGNVALDVRYIWVGRFVYTAAGR